MFGQLSDAKVSHAMKDMDMFSGTCGGFQRSVSLLCVCVFVCVREREREREKEMISSVGI